MHSLNGAPKAQCIANGNNSKRYADNRGGGVPMSDPTQRWRNAGVGGREGWKSNRVASTSREGGGSSNFSVGPCQYPCIAAGVPLLRGRLPMN